MRAGSIGFVWAALACGAVCLSAEAPSAREILQAAGVRGGLVVHLGCGDGKRTAGLCAGEGFLVQGLDADAANVDKARRHVRSLGLYGRVSIDRQTAGRLPYVDGLVNLVLGERMGGAAMGEVLRVLCPGGVAYVRSDEGQWTRTVKPRPADIDEWTHRLHDAGGNAVAADRVVGPPRHLQWTAGPLWARSHGWTPSVSAMVSAGGRVFCILDETLTGIDGTVPDKWTLVARDAFSGVLLWKRPVPHWGSQEFSGTTGAGKPVTTGRFTMPPQVGQRLLAVGDTVYVTLGAAAPVTALDAATGAERMVYADTAGADEVLCDGGRLIVSINVTRRTTDAPPGKALCAVDAATGRLLWKRPSLPAVASTRGQDPFGRLELLAGGGRVYILTTEAIEALDAATGKTAWRTDRPALPSDAVRRLGFAGVFEYLLTVLVYHDSVVLLAQPEPNTPHTYHTMPGTLYAFDAATGRQMWKHPYGGWGHCTPPDVFVVNGTVWTHVHAEAEFASAPAGGLRAKNSAAVDYRIQGLDLRTGQVQKELRTKDLFNVGHHHRCYRNKITERFVMSSRRGVELVDLQSGENFQNHWVRSGCLLGNLPCNGLVYVAPHPCSCYIEAKLTGFNALASARAAGSDTPAGERLHRGPAYGQAAAEQPPQAGGDDWPTYRHDGLRSGASESPVPAELDLAWKAEVGSRPSGLVVAGGKLHVADVDAHTVHALNAADGSPAWSHTASARVDSPPTVTAGLAIFGSADGCVYCLRADSGQLVWRFDAAPAETRLVAMGQLESPWPVPGSVLVHEGACWFAAGRSSYLDGGIRLYALDPRTGRASVQRTIDNRDPNTGKVTPQTSANVIPGLLNDIPATDGREVFIRQMNVTSPDSRAGLHLFTNGGYLDESWFNRTFWKVGQARTSGVMVLGKDTAYGVEVYPASNRETVFQPGGKAYRLCCFSLKPDKAAAKGGEAQTRPAKQQGPMPLWQQHVGIRITAMIRAGETLFVAGSPDVVDPADPHGAWEGRKGGVLAAYSTADGAKLAEYKLPAPPVWDGLAAAGGRLYLATTAGQVLCFTPKSKP